MEKLAQTQYPIHELLKRRWSPRAYSNRPVEKEKLLSLLEAARWAPSCFNEQPWAYLVARSDKHDEFEKMLSCLNDSNQVWAKTAPVLMISVAKLAFERNGKPNRHAQHDVGLATENLVIQAMALDLFVHQMAGFSVEKATALFSIQENWEPMAAMTIGYLGDPASLPLDLSKREIIPSQRKEQSSFVFSGKWNQPAF